MQFVIHNSRHSYTAHNDVGPRSILAKLDVKSAFHLLPVHPTDRHLLAMCWNNQIWFDTCIPYGLQWAPKLFNILVDFLSWTLDKQGISPVIHILDDFLTMGSADSTTCHDNFVTIQTTFQGLGIPLATEFGRLIPLSHIFRDWTGHSLHGSKNAWG